MDLQESDLVMTWQESLEWQAKEKAFLDTIDLLPLLTKGTNLYDLEDYIEDTYGNQYKDEEYIFNCMDTADFVEYLRKRYPDIHIAEQETITYVIY